MEEDIKIEIEIKRQTEEKANNCRQKI